MKTSETVAPPQSRASFAFITMCMKVTCENCQKITWRGCGKHAEAVMKDVPEDQKCKCLRDSSGN